MSKAHTLRPIRVGLALAIAVLAALIALAVAGGPAALANGNDGRDKGSISKKELALRNDMRRLWEDHITWTRLAIISLTTGAPDTQVPSAACSRTRTTWATRSSPSTALPRARS